MAITRREFIGSLVVTPALGKILPRQDSASEDDPLGVRRDFSLSEQMTFLNSAYIAPCPASVVEEGCSFLKAKAKNPISLSDMLEKTETVRSQFARMVGVSPEEISFI